MGEGDIPGAAQRSAQHARRKLTVAQAADALGVTVDAVRSRIKRETIEHVREEGRVYVILGDDQGETSADQANDQHSAQYDDQGQGEPERDPDYRDELVEELRDRVRYLEEESRRKDHLLAAALERIPAIEAPRETRASSETPSDGEAGTGTPAGDTGQPRRSWWRKFFGFE